MAEYIEREALIKYIEGDLSLCDNALSENAPITYGCKLGLRAALGYAQAIAAADVVEVVRCKDCKHWNNGYCCGVPLVGDDASYVATEETDYCSYGCAKMDGKGE